MKITKVDIMQIKTPDPSWRPILRRVYTDEGIYGGGGATLAYSIAAPATFGMIRDLAALIVSMDPLDNEVIWDTFCKNIFWGQSGGPVVFTRINAIDPALWDIRGKFFSVPVYKPLGDRKQDNLRCYTSQLQFGWSDHWEEAEDTEEYAASTKEAVERGYDVIRIDFFTFDRENGRRFDKTMGVTSTSKWYHVGLAEECVAVACETVGPDADTIMENHSVLDANGAVQLTKVAGKYNIFYFEGPNTPSPKTIKFIAGHINIPISCGGKVYFRQ